MKTFCRKLILKISFPLKNKLKTNDFAWISHVFAISRIFCLISLVKRTVNFEDDIFREIEIFKINFEKSKLNEF